MTAAAVSGETVIAGMSTRSGASAVGSMAGIMTTGELRLVRVHGAIARAASSMATVGAKTTTGAASASHAVVVSLAGIKFARQAALTAHSATGATQGTGYRHGAVLVAAHAHAELAGLTIRHGQSASHAGHSAISKKLASSPAAVDLIGRVHTHALQARARQHVDLIGMARTTIDLLSKAA